MVPARSFAWFISDARRHDPPARPPTVGKRTRAHPQAVSPSASQSPEPMHAHAWILEVPQGWDAEDLAEYMNSHSLDKHETRKKFGPVGLGKWLTVDQGNARIWRIEAILDDPAPSAEPAPSTSTAAPHLHARPARHSPSSPASAPPTHSPKPHQRWAATFRSHPGPPPP